MRRNMNRLQGLVTSPFLYFSSPREALITTKQLGQKHQCNTK